MSIASTARRAAGCLSVLLTFALPSSAPGGQEDEHRRKVEEHYSRWVGVQAPEFGPEIVDRTTGPRLFLKPLLGKRVLLISFDAGDFNRAPDEQAVLKTLRAIDKARKAAGRDKLAIVGFTQGMMFIWPHAPKPPGEFGELSDFPIANVLNRAFDEPYSLLSTPGAIAIDSKGVIRALIPHELSEKEIADIAALGDLDQSVRPAPVEDPWEGKGPPKPLHELRQVWSAPVEGIIGMTGGDWDLAGRDDVIALTSSEIVLLDGDDGRVRRRIPVTGAKLPKPSRFLGQTYHPEVQLQWAEIQKGQTALVSFEGGWPEYVSVLGANGAPVWRYRVGDGINCVQFVDLRGAGEQDVLVGINGSGLHAVDAFGRLRWSIETESGVFSVAGIGARDGRPGRALYCDGDKIRVVDDEGKELRALPNEGHEVIRVAAAELDDTGTRQVLAVWPAIVGKLDYAVATDIDGKVLWKYPVNAYNMLCQLHSIACLEMDGDAKRDWVIATGRGEIAIVNASGQLLAKFVPNGKPLTAWSTAPRTNKPGRVLLATVKGMEVYEVQTLARNP